MWLILSWITTNSFPRPSKWRTLFEGPDWRKTLLLDVILLFTRQILEVLCWDRRNIEEDTRAYLQLIQANSKEYLWMVLIKLLQSVMYWIILWFAVYYTGITVSSTPFTYINRFLYVIHISFPSSRVPHVACIYL